MAWDFWERKMIYVTFCFLNISGFVYIWACYAQMYTISYHTSSISVLSVMLILTDILLGVTYFKNPGIIHKMPVDK